MRRRDNSSFTAPAAILLAFVLLFLTCISIPFAQDIRLFTLVDHSTGGSIRFGLWGYCLRANVDGYPPCTKPELGWTFDNVPTLTGLENTISSKSTSSLVIHPLVTIGVFVIFLFAASSAFKLSFQRNSTSKSSSRLLPTTLTLIAAIFVTAVCIVDVVILTEVKRRVRRASGTAKNMKAYTGAIPWLAFFAAVVLWISTIMLAFLSRKKRTRTKDSVDDAYDSDASTYRRDSEVRSVHGSYDRSRSRTPTDYDVRSRTATMTNIDDPDDELRSRTSYDRRSRDMRSQSPVHSDRETSYDDDRSRKEKGGFLASICPCFRRDKDKDEDERESDIEMASITRSRSLRTSELRSGTDDLRRRKSSASYVISDEPRAMSDREYTPEASGADRYSRSRSLEDVPVGYAHENTVSRTPASTYVDSDFEREASTPGVRSMRSEGPVTDYISDDRPGSQSRFEDEPYVSRRQSSYIDNGDREDQYTDDYIDTASRGLDSDREAYSNAEPVAAGYVSDRRTRDPSDTSRSQESFYDSEPEPRGDSYRSERLTDTQYEDDRGMTDFNSEPVQRSVPPEDDTVYSDRLSEERSYISDRPVSDRGLSEARTATRYSSPVEEYNSVDERGLTTSEPYSEVQDGERIATSYAPQEPESDVYTEPISREVTSVHDSPRESTREESFDRSPDYSASRTASIYGDSENGRGLSSPGPEIEEAPVSSYISEERPRTQSIYSEEQSALRGESNVEDRDVGTQYSDDYADSTSRRLDSDRGDYTDAEPVAAGYVSDRRTSNYTSRGTEPYESQQATDYVMSDHPSGENDRGMTRYTSDQPQSTIPLDDGIYSDGPLSEDRAYESEQPELEREMTRSAEPAYESQPFESSYMTERISDAEGGNDRGMTQYSSDQVQSLGPSDDGLYSDRPLSEDRPYESEQPTLERDMTRSTDPIYESQPAEDSYMTERISDAEEGNDRGVTQYNSDQVQSLVHSDDDGIYSDGPLSEDRPYESEQPVSEREMTRSAEPAYESQPGENSYMTERISDAEEGNDRGVTQYNSDQVQSLVDSDDGIYSDGPLSEDRPMESEQPALEQTLSRSAESFHESQPDDEAYSSELPRDTENENDRGMTEFNSDVIRTSDPVEDQSVYTDKTPSEAPPYSPEPQGSDRGLSEASAATRYTSLVEERNSTDERGLTRSEPLSEAEDTERAATTYASEAEPEAEPQSLSEELTSKYDSPPISTEIREMSAVSSPETPVSRTPSTSVYSEYERDTGVQTEAPVSTYVSDERTLTRSELGDEANREDQRFVSDDYADVSRDVGSDREVFSDGQPVAAGYVSDRRTTGDISRSGESFYESQTSETEGPPVTEYENDRAKRESDPVERSISPEADSFYSLSEEPPYDLTPRESERGLSNTGFATVYPSASEEYKGTDEREATRSEPFSAEDTRRASTTYVPETESRVEPEFMSEEPISKYDSPSVSTEIREVSARSPSELSVSRTPSVSAGSEYGSGTHTPGTRTELLASDHVSDERTLTTSLFGDEEDDVNRGYQHPASDDYADEIFRDVNTDTEAHSSAEPGVAGYVSDRRTRGTNESNRVTKSLYESQPREDSYLSELPQENVSESNRTMTGHESDPVERSASLEGDSVYSASRVSDELLPEERPYDSNSRDSERGFSDKGVMTEYTSVSEEHNSMDERGPTRSELLSEVEDGERNATSNVRESELESEAKVDSAPFSDEPVSERDSPILSTEKRAGGSSQGSLINEPPTPVEELDSMDDRRTTEPLDSSGDRTLSDREPESELESNRESRSRLETELQPTSDLETGASVQSEAPKERLSEYPDSDAPFSDHRSTAMSEHDSEGQISPDDIVTESIESSEGPEERESTHPLTASEILSGSEDRDLAGTSHISKSEPGPEEVSSIHSEVPISDHPGSESAVSAYEYLPPSTRMSEAEVSDAEPPPPYYSGDERDRTRSLTGSELLSGNEGAQRDDSEPEFRKSRSWSERERFTSRYSSQARLSSEDRLGSDRATHVRSVTQEDRDTSYPDNEEPVSERIPSETENTFNYSASDRYTPQPLSPVEGGDLRDSRYSERQSRSYRPDDYVSSRFTEDYNDMDDRDLTRSPRSSGFLSGNENGLYRESEPQERLTSSYVSEPQFTPGQEPGSDRASYIRSYTPDKDRITRYTTSEGAYDPASERIPSETGNNFNYSAASEVYSPGRLSSPVGGMRETEYPGERSEYNTPSDYVPNRMSSGGERLLSGESAPAPEPRRSDPWSEGGRSTSPYASRFTPEQELESNRDSYMRSYTPEDRISPYAENRDPYASSYGRMPSVTRGDSNYPVASEVYSPGRPSSPVEGMRETEYPERRSGYGTPSNYLPSRMSSDGGRLLSDEPMPAPEPLRSEPWSDEERLTSPYASRFTPEQLDPNRAGYIRSYTPEDRISRYAEDREPSYVSSLQRMPSVTRNDSDYSVASEVYSPGRLSSPVRAMRETEYPGERSEYNTPSDYLPTRMSSNGGRLISDEPVPAPEHQRSEPWSDEERLSSPYASRHTPEQGLESSYIRSYTPEDRISPYTENREPSYVSSLDRIPSVTGNNSDYSVASEVYSPGRLSSPVGGMRETEYPGERSEYNTPSDYLPTRMSSNGGRLISDEPVPAPEHQMSEPWSDEERLSSPYASRFTPEQGLESSYIRSYTPEDRISPYTENREPSYVSSHERVPSVTGNDSNYPATSEVYSPGRLSSPVGGMRETEYPERRSGYKSPNNYPSDPWPDEERLTSPYASPLIPEQGLESSYVRSYTPEDRISPYTENREPSYVSSLERIPSVTRNDSDYSVASEVYSPGRLSSPVGGMRETEYPGERSEYNTPSDYPPTRMSSNGGRLISDEPVPAPEPQMSEPWSDEERLSSPYASRFTPEQGPESSYIQSYTPEDRISPYTENRGPSYVSSLDRMPSVTGNDSNYPATSEVYSPGRLSSPVGGMRETEYPGERSEYNTPSDYLPTRMSSNGGRLTSDEPVPAPEHQRSEPWSDEERLSSPYASRFTPEQGPESSYIRSYTPEDRISPYTENRGPSYVSSLDRVPSVTGNDSNYPATSEVYSPGRLSSPVGGMRETEYPGERSEYNTPSDYLPTRMSSNGGRLTSDEPVPAPEHQRSEPWSDEERLSSPYASRFTPEQGLESSYIRSYTPEDRISPYTENRGPSYVSSLDRMPSVTGNDSNYSVASEVYSPGRLSSPVGGMRETEYPGERSEYNTPSDYPPTRMSSNGGRLISDEPVPAPEPQMSEPWSDEERLTSPYDSQFTPERELGSNRTSYIQSYASGDRATRYPDYEEPYTPQPQPSPREPTSGSWLSGEPEPDPEPRMSKPWSDEERLTSSYASPFTPEQGLESDRASHGRTYTPTHTPEERITPYTDYEEPYVPASPTTEDNNISSALEGYTPERLSSSAEGGSMRETKYPEELSGNNGPEGSMPSRNSSSTRKSGHICSECEMSLSEKSDRPYTETERGREREASSGPGDNNMTRICEYCGAYIYN